MIEEENASFPKPISENVTPILHKGLTPEQRRILGSGRSFYDARKSAGVSAPASLPDPVPIGPQPASSPRARDRQPPPRKTVVAAKPSRVTTVASDRRPPRLFEVQHALLLFVAMLLLGSAFYVGKKFDYWKYLIQSRKTPELSGVGSANQFPGISAAELVEQALIAEQSSNWKEAAEKLVAAKRKDLRYRGILLRAGTMAFEHGDLDTADKLFDRAIAFGENIDIACYFRGQIAMKRRDSAAAQHFFRLAAAAEPFASYYYFCWAEAIRMDRHPLQAIPYYERAERRTRSEKDQTVCRFKVRLARLETGQISQLETEIQSNRDQNELSVDWMMTDAALKIRQGKIPEAVGLISAARNADKQGLFGSCVTDSLFQDASAKYPELAEMCRTNDGPAFRAP